MLLLYCITLPHGTLVIQQNKQPHVTHINTEHKKYHDNYGVGNQSPVLELAQTWCRIKTGYWDPEP